MSAADRQSSAEGFPDQAPLSRLPLVTLYISDRCNSRCVTCDYWRHGRADMNLEAVARLLPAFAQLQTRMVLLSGGEPLLNPEWGAIAELLRRNGLKVWLLTSGLALAKRARRAADSFDAITVSLDGTDPETYAAIRGLDAFDKVCKGIRAVAALGPRPGIRVTLQRGNYRQLPAFVDLAKELGARQLSFLAVDVANPHAFGRTDDFDSDLALQPEDLPQLARILDSLEREHEEDFRSGFIAESPQKLQRIWQYFAAILEFGPYPKVRCNAPEFSAVVGATGRVQPCFFISGPLDARLSDTGTRPGAGLPGVLNSSGMSALRTAIRNGRRGECKTCVCSMWRDLDIPDLDIECSSAPPPMVATP
ncbi:MAG TPA: radical SAM/SPASM domain-containing protein [Steroidobacteraceae bacterium]|nr:radical SAM/SPASM domain-containing protein [Steroidobacteraceae bacterium]